MNKENLDKISEEIKSCQRCALAKIRTNCVPGKGNPGADLLFVGEAPGKNEDLRGEPFCGRAGKVLDQLLQAAGRIRSEVFIANILKCRPPGNRNPSPDEIKLCTPYLVRQIKVIRPKIICCLGNFSSSFVMEKLGLANKIQGVGKIHGKIFIPPKAGSLKVIPLYHPASAIYNPGMIKVLTKDFEMLKNIPV